MIAAAYNGGVDILRYIWESSGATTGTTTAGDLRDAALASFPGQWIARSYVWEEVITMDNSGHDPIVENYRWYNADSNVAAESLKEKLRMGHYVMALVKMQYDYGHGDSRTGWSEVISTGNTPHWVVITGFSAPWNNNDPSSSYNWIRINNPYNNRVEYYPWMHFYDSLVAYSLVEIWPGHL